MLAAVYAQADSHARSSKALEQSGSFGTNRGTYELATHTVKVKRSGTVADISTLWELEGATTPLLLNKAGKDMIALFEEMGKPQFGRIQSIDVFNQVCVLWEITYLNGERFDKFYFKEKLILSFLTTTKYLLTGFFVF